MKASEINWSKVNRSLNSYEFELHQIKGATLAQKIRVIFNRCFR